MKNNKKEIYLIIITTFFSVIIMVFSFSIKQPKSYIDEKIEESEENYLYKDIAFNKNKEESLLSEKDNQISKNNADQGINITNKKEDILEEDEFSSIYNEHVEVIDEEN